jgi:hypothetical protein
LVEIRIFPGFWWFPIEEKNFLITYLRISPGFCKDVHGYLGRILLEFSKQNRKRNEHIEYRSLDLQYTNQSAYPAGCAMLFYILSTYNILISISNLHWCLNLIRNISYFKKMQKMEYFILNCNFGGK